MTVIPTTKVRLLSNVPLHNQYEHQMTFTSKAEQETYFLNRPSFSFTDFTYQREEQAIKVPKPYDELYHCNYVMYQNTDYTNKWFYGFITKKEYVNPNTTRIYFELDVFQTWQFDLNWKPSYVIREHTKRWNDDGTPVINTIDEGLDYGTEYETISVENIRPNGGYKWLVIVTKTPLHMDTGEAEPTVIGTPQPLSYYMVPFKDNGDTPLVNGEPVTMPELLLKEIYKDEQAVNNVVSLYVTDYTGIPTNFSDGGSGVDNLTFTDPEIVVEYVSVNTQYFLLYVKKVPEFKETPFVVSADKYDGFTQPQESKLLMHPYTVTVLEDFKGNRIQLKNEYIRRGDLTLSIKGSLGTSNKVSWAVKGYNMETVAYENQVLNEYALINQDPNDVPILNDYLSAYLQGNKNSLQAQRESILFNSLSGIIGGAIGGGIGAIGGTAYTMGQSYYQIQGLNAKLKDIDNVPPSISKMGSNTAYDYGNGYNGVYVIKKQITAEYRKRLGDYFKMFGYKVNTLKVPNLKSRQHFNYIQTAAANIFGNVPMDDMNKIKEMFNKGVTLWHGDWVGDYSKVNDEL